MKYYLAGPMSGIPEYNYPAFTAAAEALRAKEFEVVSPHELHNGDTGQPYAYYLRRDLVALLECQAVVLLPGWQQATGVQLELTVARALEMPVYRLAEVA